MTTEEARLRRRRQALWAVVWIVLAAAVTARVVAGEVRVVARVVFFAGVVLGLIGLVLAARSGRLGRTVGSPSSALDQQQRRHLLLEVQGRAPADPAQLDLARDLARRLSERSLGAPLLFGGLMLMGVAGLFGRPSGPRIGGVAVALAFFLILLVVGAVQARRARRFLAEHPASGSEA